MNERITVGEFNEIKKLVAINNNLIIRFEQFSDKIKEPQLKAEFQKLYAMAVNHKKELLSVLEQESSD